MQQASELDGAATLELPPKLSAEYLQCLQDLVHSPATLKQKGFIIEQLSVSDLEKKKRCLRCCRAMKPMKPPKQPHETWRRDNDAREKCKYHDGEFNRQTRKWTCCDKPAMTKPCTSMEQHIPRLYRPGEIEKNWQFHPTPPPMPQCLPSAAVVFDCEMGVTEAGESELIRVSVVDYFSSIVLLDSLVWPDAKMSSLNTPFSGVTWKALHEARRNRTCLFGRRKAREAVWSLIGPDTVVIGHGANNDLNILRWIHPCIVDTLLVEQNFRKLQEDAANEQEAQEGKQQQDPAPIELGKNKEEQKDAGTDIDTKPPEGRGGGGGGLSLKKLTKERLGRTIQISGKGHDSIEDAIATRDILHWHVSQILQASH